MRFPLKSVFLSLVGSAVLLAFGAAGPARAEVSVNINLGPPPIIMAEPPAVVMIPGSRVHFVPDPKIEIFFFDGFWWSPRGERWYRSRAYNGPWGAIERRNVPPSVVYVPRDYRERYGHERNLPYGQWKKEHGKWDKENRKAHRGWEKERKKEWKEREKEGKREDKREYKEEKRDGRDEGRGGGRDEGRGRGRKD
jgi:hypothetical protein